MARAGQVKSCEQGGQNASLKYVCTYNSELKYCEQGGQKWVLEKCPKTLKGLKDGRDDVTC
jgi:hypothetical protein